MQISGEVPEASGADTVRFRRVPVQIPCKVPEGTYLVRFRKFPVQVLGEVPDGYGADSRGFWCKFPVQLRDEVLEGLLGEDEW